MALKSHFLLTKIIFLLKFKIINLLIDKTKSALFYSKKEEKMSEKRKLEKNFPLLRPYPAPEEKEKLKKHDPLFWGELQRFENFTATVLSARKRRQRIKIIAQALRDIFGAKGENKKLYQILNQALFEAQRFVKDLISKLPANFRGVVDSEGQIAEEPDFISLLEKRKRFFEEGELGKMREFEARRLIVFTLALFDLILHGQKLHLNGVSVQAITQYLERNFFDKGVIEHKRVLALHNPDDGWRVEYWFFEEDLPPDLKVKKGWKLEKYEIACRKFVWEDKSYLVYFSCRQKTPHSHLLKMLRKDIRDPYSSALDWRGIKMVFFDERALEVGLEKLRQEVFYLPGVTWKLEDGRFFKETVNVYSAKNFRAKKFVTTVGGESVEVIVETIVNHINGLVSKGEENHELYRRRQLVRSGLPLVFPKEIYGIDWEEVEQEIIDHYQG